MRTLLLLPLALLAACSTAPTELDPISYQCQQLDAYREQPALRDPKTASARRCRSPRSAMPATGNSSAGRGSPAALSSGDRRAGLPAAEGTDMDRFARLPRAALLIASLLATAPGRQHRLPRALPERGAQAAMLDVAWTTAERLDALPDVDVVVAARGGQDLSRYGLRHSHLAFLLREDDGRWRAMHLLNRCKTDSSQLYHEGLGNFVGESGHTDLRIGVPSAPCVRCARCWCRPRSSPGAARNQVQRGRYPFATDYQNSNQWVLEVLAAAMAQAEGAPAIVKREQAQQWLRRQKYQPSVLHIGLGKRVGAPVRSQRHHHRPSSRRTHLRQLFGGDGGIGVRLPAPAQPAAAGTGDPHVPVAGATAATP